MHTRNLAFMSINSSARSPSALSTTSRGVRRPRVCTLTSMRYSSGCGSLYPAKSTSLSRCSCLSPLLTFALECSCLILIYQVLSLLASHKRHSC